MKTTISIAFLAAVGVFVAFPAQAYLDPGTGSIVLQAIIGIVASVGVAMKIYWDKVKGFTSRLFGGKKADPKAGPEN